MVALRNPMRMGIWSSIFGGNKAQTEPRYWDQLSERGVHTGYRVQLLSREPVDVTELLDRVQAALADIDDEGELVNGDGIMALAFSDGSQLLFVPAEGPPMQTEINAALVQSQDWDERRSVVAECRYSLTILDVGAGEVETNLRVNRVTMATIALADERIEAIHWVPAQRVMSRETFRALAVEALTDLAVNVRVYKISADGLGWMMDTMGLAALGHPDLECYFHEVPHISMEALLMQFAEVVLAEGTAGIERFCEQGASVSLDDDSEQKFSFRLGESNAAPARHVLRIHAGRYAGASE